MLNETVRIVWVRQTAAAPADTSELRGSDRRTIKGGDMGDRGGKKDKEKNKQQQIRKQQQEDQKKKDKALPRTSRKDE